MSMLAMLCTVATLKVAIVNLIGGSLYGFSIGFVPIYLSYVETNTNCTLSTSDGACSTLQHSQCHWNETTQLCYFNSAVQCSDYRLEALCKDDDSNCLWDKNAGMCKNTVGWNVVQTGIFAGALIVGACVGSLTGGTLVRRLGRKRSLILVGVISLVSSVLIHVASWVDSYALLIVMRITIGAACGAICVCCPLYVDEMAPEGTRNYLGVLFQISICFSIALAATMGLAMNPTDFSDNFHMQERFQGFIAFSTVLSLALLVVGLCVPESVKWHPYNASAEEDPLVNDDVGRLRSYTWLQMVWPLTVATFLSMALQMTGINAVMNYAPNITKSMGFQPLTGNLLVMVWNFVTTLVSIPLASRFSMRQMFLTGTLIASLACLCTGIPVYPGVTTDHTRSILGAFGIAVFVAAFEIGMGPPYYVLLQELFPKAFRPKGSSYTLFVQFIFNTIINVCFPIAVQGLSGGPSGDQNQGMGTAFLFFGVIGLVSWGVLCRGLFPFDEDAAELED